MGLMKVIFEMQDPSYYGVIIDNGFCRDSRQEQAPGAEGNIIYFNYDISSFLDMRFFISNKYTVHVGDFLRQGDPVDSGEVFGPAHVFGLVANSADRLTFAMQFDKAFGLLAPHVGDLRNRLRYVGTLLYDYGLMNKDSFRETLEGVLGR